MLDTSYVILDARFSLENQVLKYCYLYLASTIHYLTFFNHSCFPIKPKWVFPNPVKYFNP